MPVLEANADRIFLLYSYYSRSTCALSPLVACLCAHILNDQSNAPTFHVENREGNQHTHSSVNEMCPGCIRHPEAVDLGMNSDALYGISGHQAACLGLLFQLSCWTQKISDKGHISFSIPPVL